MILLDRKEAPPHSIENSCYWFTYRNSVPIHEPLHGTHETDIAIVGGGFTGLWTAYFIKKLNPSVRVALLEQETIGYGASGRNGGEACSTLGPGHLSTIQHFGLEEAKKMARIAEKNYKAFTEFAADCDFENTGWLHAALLEEHMESFRNSHTAAKAVGSGNGWKFFDATEMREQLHSPLYLGGAFSPDGGIVNNLLVAAGRSKINFLLSPEWFRPMIVGQVIWKETGWGTILFLAALTAIDPQLYEAARIDGAGRWAQTWHVTLPGIKSTIVILFILRLGNFLDSGFEQIFLMLNAMNEETGNVFDTFVYISGIQQGNFSYATAANLFKSLVGITLVLFANGMAKKAGEEGIY